MPELPEVETIAKQLRDVLPGKVIKSVEVLREKSFRGQAQNISGRAIKTVGRKAKTIIVEFQEAEEVILIHLKMTGQLIFVGSGKRVVGGHPTEDWVNDLPSKHTRVIIRFTDASTLYFNDMRVFGWVKIVPSAEFQVQNKRLPPDVIDPEFTVEYLANILKKSQKSVKLVLMDQDKIGGMGNIYTNDALWLSGAKPTRKANSVSRQEINRLHQAMVQVIERGIATGGASESTYKHIDGLGGKYQEEFLVYNREGQTCLKKGCPGIIEKLKIGGRGTYYCPVCQQ